MQCSAVEWSGVQWSAVEWSGVQWSGPPWSGSRRGRPRETGALELPQPPPRKCGKTLMERRSPGFMWYVDLAAEGYRSE